MGEGLRMRANDKPVKSKQPFYFGASTKAYKTARNLRESQTKAETVLWHILRNRKVGKYKFRRQHPVGPFFVDFYCHKVLLVIEVDGKIHELDDVKQYDAERQEYLEALGHTVLRFTNEMVLEEPDKVVGEILQCLERWSN
jgi:very-short-patch-repair endonuclease